MVHAFLPKKMPISPSDRVWLRPLASLGKGVLFDADSTLWMRWLGSLLKMTPERGFQSLAITGIIGQLGEDQQLWRNLGIPPAFSQPLTFPGC